jgi:hypothetical protein
MRHVREGRCIGVVAVGPTALVALTLLVAGCNPPPADAGDDDGSPCAVGFCDDGGIGDASVRDAEPEADAPDEGIIYAYRQPKAPERRHPITLASGASTTIPLTWRNAAGLAPAADLSVVADGRPVLQVASVGAHPFARAGLDVAPLDPGIPYNLVLTREDDSVKVALIRADAAVPNVDSNAVVLHAQARVDDGRIADNAPIADVILPAPFWRSSIVADFPGGLAVSPKLTGSKPRAY